MADDTPTPDDDDTANQNGAADGASGEASGEALGEDAAGADPADAEAIGAGPGDDSLVPAGGRIANLDIREEMQQSYLSYAMSVIVSRALPDVRDGLKPVQRRILYAMRNLTPSSGRSKCAKVCGDTSGNYHPHGEAAIYPALVRLGQDWSLRQVLIDKQGNFGSNAGLPPAAMRYTEARLAPAAMDLLADIDRGTVDFAQTYNQEDTEPVVLPSRFPNLLVNGSTGIAVGMATSIPPHNLGEVADAVIKLIDNPEATLDDLMDVLPGPDFPTGGVICGRFGIKQGYATGRSTLTLRAKTHFEVEKKSDVIVVTEIPFMETRDRVREKIEQLIRDDRIKGISRVVDFTDRKLPTWQCRIHIYLKRDFDPEVVLNQLFKLSSLQGTVSMILLALVGDRPQTLTLPRMLDEFLRHRVDVIRRRTEHQLAAARKRKHTVEGLMIAQLNIDEVIQTIRDAASRSAAKEDLQNITVPREMIERALGNDGFARFMEEQGDKSEYSLSPNQAEAIVSMQLGSLANLERGRLSEEHAGLLETIAGCVELLSDEANIRAVVRDDMEEMKAKYASGRRTEIDPNELGDVNRDDLITEESMVVTISQRGYLKRTPLSEYQAQHRGGKGITGAKTDEEDAVEQLFVASTHAWLLFFTDRGRVHWQKVYDLPQGSRTAKGRAMANVLSLEPEERVINCVWVRQWDEAGESSGEDAGRFLLMATRKGIIKKTALSAYSRPQKNGIIAINLDDDDTLIDVDKVSPGQDVVLSTASGMAIRFTESDARAMGRNTRGVKGINLAKGDTCVAMEVVQPGADLLTITENGYGKRTPFGDLDDAIADTDDSSDADAGDGDDADEPTDESTEASGYSGNARYRRQRRGGKGLRDIKTTQRNGRVVGALAVVEGDDILMVSTGGKIQRVHAGDISEVGRNTQGVRIMRLSGSDAVASIARIPAEVEVDAEEADVETAGEAETVEA